MADKAINERINQELPTWKAPLAIVRTFLGGIDVVFKIDFNPENWNYFPSLDVRCGDQRIWNCQQDGFYDQAFLVDVDGKRRYYKVKTIDETTIEAAIDDSYNLMGEASDFIAHLEDLNDIPALWTAACEKYGFGVPKK